MSRCVTCFNRCLMALWIVGVGVAASGTAHAESLINSNDAVPCENRKDHRAIVGADSKVTDGIGFISPPSPPPKPKPEPCPTCMIGQSEAKPSPCPSAPKPPNCPLCTGVEGDDSSPSPMDSDPTRLP